MSESTTLSSPPSRGSERKFGVRRFLGAVAVLTLVRLGVSLLAVPPGAALTLSFITTLLFIAMPVVAIAWGADDDWTPTKAVALLAAGLALHIGGAALARSTGIGLVAQEALFAVANGGLLVWCLGLGALLASIVRDANLLLPMAIFLAGFDMYLVFAPLGVVRRVVEQAPGVFTTAAYTPPTTASIGPLVHIGPADFVFLSLFLVAVRRFAMRSRETLLWLAPVLLGFVLVVLLFGHVSIGPLSLAMLPALVPIGVTVLLVNRRHFKMTSQEVAATVVVAIVAVGLAVIGLVQSSQAAKQAQPAAPSPSFPVPAQPGPGL